MLAYPALGMPRVLIIVDPPDDTPQSGTIGVDSQQSSSALKQVILAQLGNDADSKASSVKVVTTVELNQHPDWQALALDGAILCPLTLDLPEWLNFPMKRVYQACQDILGLRHRLEPQYATGGGNLWLPIIQTQKGPLYGEIIGLVENGRPQLPDNPPKAAEYVQPVHLKDLWRQPIYEMAQTLLRSLNALPAVYLMQFSIQEQSPCFDRLLPYPEVPALASVGVQTPDLFECYWHCILGNPIRDVTISTSHYSMLPLP